MTFEELWDVAIATMRVTDVPMHIGKLIFKQMIEDLQRHAYFNSLMKTMRVSVPEHGWGVALPEDFYDDDTVIVVSKVESRAAYPLIPCKSADMFVAYMGNARLENLRNQTIPTLSTLYCIEKPSAVYEDADSIFDKIDVPHLLLFPPLDNSLYEVLLTYVMKIVPENVHESYTNVLMQKYPEWIQFEFIWRLATSVRDFELAQIYRDLAAAKFLEVKATEVKEKLTPAPTLKLSVPHEPVRIITKRPPVR